MKEKYKVVIGLPSSGSIKIETAIYLQALVASTNDYYKDRIGIAFAFAVGSYIHENRNIITMCAQQEKATHLMFIDTDMMFPANGLIALLEDKKLIIGADYNKRKPLVEGSKELEHVTQWDEDKYDKDNPFECARLGMGFTLIDMSVFEKIERPWFFFEPGTKDTPMLGEDYYFSKKAIENGIKIYCDPRLKLGHIGSAVY